MATKATVSVSFPKLSKIIFGKWLFFYSSIVKGNKETQKHKSNSVKRFRSLKFLFINLSID